MHDSMEKFVNLLRMDTFGNISFQVCIIGALVIGFGALIIEQFSHSGWTHVNNTVHIMDDKIPFNESTQQVQQNQK